MQELDLVVRTLIVNEFDKWRSEVFDRVMQGEEVSIIKPRNHTLAVCPKPSSVSHFLRKPPTS